MFGANSDASETVSPSNDAFTGEIILMIWKTLSYCNGKKKQSKIYNFFSNFLGIFFIISTKEKSSSLNNLKIFLETKFIGFKSMDPTQYAIPEISVPINPFQFFLKNFHLKHLQ